MFHTERTYAMRKNMFTKRPVPLKEDDLFPIKVTKAKVKSTLHRNRKLLYSSSPFVNLKKEVL